MHANVKLFSYRKGNCGSFGCYLIQGSTYWLNLKKIIALGVVIGILNERHYLNCIPSITNVAFACESLVCWD